MDNSTVGMIHNYILPIILFLAGQTIFFIIAWVNFRTEVMTRLKVLEIEMSIEKRSVAILGEKLDDLLAGMQRIEIELANKKDREK